MKVINELLNSLKVGKHSFKTIIRKVSYGFYFLGYRLTNSSAKGVEVAWRTISNYL